MTLLVTVVGVTMWKNPEHIWFLVAGSIGLVTSGYGLIQEVDVVPGHSWLVTTHYHDVACTALVNEHGGTYYWYIVTGLSDHCQHFAVLNVAAHAVHFALLFFATTSISVTYIRYGLSMRRAFNNCCEGARPSFRDKFQGKRGRDARVSHVA
jgi:hypothetical protein